MATSAALNAVATMPLGDERGTINDDSDGDNDDGVGGGGEVWRIVLATSLAWTVLAMALSYAWIRRQRRIRSDREREATPPPLPSHQAADEDHAHFPYAQEETNPFGLTQDIQKFLTSIKLFTYFDEPIIFELMKHIQTLKVPQGAVIFNKGDLDRSLYIVIKGAVQVFVDDTDSGQERLINEVHEGENLSSLLNVLLLLTGESPSPLPVAARACAPTELIKIPPEAFLNLKEHFPSTIHQLIQIIMTRFQRVTSITLNHYFGLTAELLQVETNLADPSNSKLLLLSPTDTEPKESDDDAAEDEDAAETAPKRRPVFNVNSITAEKLAVDRIAELLGANDDVSQDILKQEVTLLKYNAGDILVGHMDRSAGLFLLISGTLELAMYGIHNERVKLSEVPIFSAAGFLSLLTGHPSFLEIKAGTSCRVAFLPRRCFEHLVEKTPTIRITLAHNLARKLPLVIRQIDYALDWMHVNAGQIIYRQDDHSDAIYLVLHGRLRAWIKTKEGGSKMMGEYGQGDSAGDLEVLTDSTRPWTVYAVRDTELARIPKTLFNLLMRYPQVTIQISRIIARRSRERLDTAMLERISNVKTVAIVSAFKDHSEVFDEFSCRLYAALSQLDSALMLTSQTVTDHIGKNAFNVVGRLKLLSWLEEQEESHRIVLYQCDNPGSPWMHRCIRQADVILIVGLVGEDPSVSDAESLMKGMKTTARKELVLLQHYRSLIPGTTYAWLEKRPWVSMHHHVEIQWKPVSIAHRSTELDLKQLLWEEGRYTKSDESRTGILRLARHLLGQSVGVVLGGGGARGLAHIGVLKALEESGIPVDYVGGVSIGAFVGGLYARDADITTIQGWARVFCTNMSSVLRQAYDLTYPITSWFSGSGFNKLLYKCFSNEHIEDLWLNYFCVTTNITQSREELHRSGIMWRYIRASMSLSGYLPPICDRGIMLLDGGYVNNLPADVMRSQIGAQRIIAVDVGAPDDTSLMEYGDSLSGWWLLLWSFVPFVRKTKAPTMADIQYKLAYVSSVKQLESVTRLEGMYYLQPPVSKYGTMDFGRYEEIIQAGYAYGMEVIERWRQEGVFSDFLLLPFDTKGTSRRVAMVRRASM